MAIDRLMPIRSPEFTAMSERVLEATRLTSRLNVLPFDDEAGRADLLEQILGRPLPASAAATSPGRRSTSPRTCGSARARRSCPA